MIQYLIIGIVGVLSLVGLGVALYSIKLTHDEIRSRNRHLSEQVHAATGTPAGPW